MSTPSISDIYKYYRQYVENSGFEVEVRESLPTVQISNDSEDGFFLEGHEAQNYIDECIDILGNNGGDGSLDWETVTIGHAKQYIDSL